MTPPSTGISGGAIYPNGSSTTISGSTFQGNNAVGSGGSIHSNSTLVDVANSTFVDNSARNGGAIDSREDGREPLGAIVRESEPESTVGAATTAGDGERREEDGDDDGTGHRMILSAALFAASRSERMRRLSGSDSASC